MVLISYLFIVVFITAFLVDILPFRKITKEILALSKKSVETLQVSNIDDSIKQKLLLSNSFGIFKQSLKIGLFTLIIIGVVYGCFLLSGYITRISYDNLVDYSLTLNGIIISIIAFLSYFLLKKLYVKFRV